MTVAVGHAVGIGEAVARGDVAVGWRDDDGVARGGGVAVAGSGVGVAGRGAVWVGAAAVGRVDVLVGTTSGGSCGFGN